MLLYVIILSFVLLAILLAWYLIARDRGQKEPVLALWLAAAFGLAGAIIASYAEGLLVPYDGQAGTGHLLLLLSAMSVGVIEEVCKFLPLAVFMYKKPYFNEHTDGVIYFALAGLGFDLPENILYTLQFGTQAGKLRLILTPLFHAAATGLIGYYLVKGKLNRKPVLGIILPLAAVAFVHGLYNFGLAVGSDIFLMIALSITLGLSGGLFMVYMRATHRDQDLGLSAVGHNSFCRSCGTPNPKHYLYCVHCGNRA